MELKTADVINLQSRFMRDDIAVRGYSAALSGQIRKLANETEKVAIYSRIDELPEDVLDILAWQFDVLWYDSDSTITEKRKNIKKAIEIHRIKGTPAAVQMVIEIYFGDGDVEEWFDYGGDPGHFRVTTANPSADAEKATLLANAVNAVKRLSAHFDGVIVSVTSNNELFYGAASHMAGSITVEQVV
jgi:phage tail P2-like protein